MVFVLFTVIYVEYVLTNLSLFCFLTFCTVSNCFEMRSRMNIHINFDIFKQNYASPFFSQRISIYFGYNKHFHISTLVIFLETSIYILSKLSKQFTISLLVSGSLIQLSFEIEIDYEKGIE